MLFLTNPFSTLYITSQTSTLWVKLKSVFSHVLKLYVRVLCFDTESYYEDHTGFTLGAVFLPQPSECWGYRCEPPHVAVENTVIQALRSFSIRATMTTKKRPSTNLSPLTFPHRRQGHGGSLEPEMKFSRM